MNYFKYAKPKPYGFVDIFFLLLLASVYPSSTPSLCFAADPAGGTTVFPPQQTQSTPQATYKAQVNMVNIVFTVTDNKNLFISNLAEQDFEVLEDGLPQQILYFNNYSRGGEIPITMALLIDTSGSVKDKLRLEVDTALEFLRNILRPNKDLAMILQFSSEVELVQDFTDNLKLLEKGLDSLRGGGGTSLYDAVFLAVSEKLRHEAGRKVIVILSDGADNQSKVKKEEALQASQRADVLVYGIGVRGSGYPADFGVLKLFAKDTGGRFFLAKIKLAELQQAFLEINQDLKNQYALAYSPTNTKMDGTFRRTEVRVKKKGLVVKSRSGYFAPAEK